MKIKKLILFLIPALTLCGCKFFKNIIVDGINDAISGNPKGGSLGSEIAPFNENSGEGYCKYSNFSYNIQDIKTTIDCKPMKSVGQPNLLVVPVELKNTKNKWTKEMLGRIEQAFFADSSNTNVWESVSSYYKKSSYGKLEITGSVTDVLTSSYTVDDAKKKNGDSYDIDTKLCEEFCNKSKFYNARKSGDSDADGYIDGICFIYSEPFEIADDTPFWAWTYWTNYAPNYNFPVIKSYMWASYSFVNDCNYLEYASSKLNIDAHTYIHETGHLLGLDDYYCYDDIKFDPSGKLEMQSYNIGDQNIFSKFALGWAEPYYVKTTSSVTLTLRTSAFYGDAILINDTWNKSSMDEYLLIEYYSPFGNNYHDANYSYLPNGKAANKMYTVSGFRIYHVDARMLQVTKSSTGKNVFSFTDTFNASNYYVIGASNSPSRSYFTQQLARENFKELHLLEAGGSNTFKNGNSATNETLFKNGNSFVPSDIFFENGTKFNDNTEIGYTISVNSCFDNYGTITITKK